MDLDHQPSTGSSTNAQTQNVMAAISICKMMYSLLGPHSRSKLIQDSQGRIIITRDGASFLNAIKVVHPAALRVIDASRLQDKLCGDGTTSVAVLIGLFLEQAQKLMLRSISTNTIIQGYELSLQMIEKMLEEVPSLHDEKNEGAIEYRLIGSIFESALSTKKILEPRVFINLLISAVKVIVPSSSRQITGSDFSRINLIPIPGLDSKSSHVIPGVVAHIKLDYAHQVIGPGKVAVFHNSPYRIDNGDNTKISLSSPQEVVQFQKSELEFLTETIKMLSEMGTKLIITNAASTEEFRCLCKEKDIAVASEVGIGIINRVLEATTASVLFSHQIPSIGDLGNFESMERRVYGEQDLWVLKTLIATEASVILHGATAQVCDELKRHAEDALKSANCIWDKPEQQQKIILGGGAFEMAAALQLKRESLLLDNIHQATLSSYANACESFVSILCENAGLEAKDAVSSMKREFIEGRKCTVQDLLKTKQDHALFTHNTSSVPIELARTKRSTFQIATKTVCDILSAQANLTSR